MVYKKTQKCHCGKAQPKFGFVGGSATACSQCKTGDMVDVTHKKCICCKARAIYGHAGQKPLCCAQCRSSTMFDLQSKRCEGPCGGTVVVHRSHRFCANCDTERKRVTRVRENVLANYLREKASLPWTSWNKQVAGTRDCTGKSYRPDFVWELPHLIIIKECDEGGHAAQGYSCDEKRMADLVNVYGGLPMVYIRWNPDAYKVKGVTRRTTMKVRLQHALEELERELRRSVEDVSKLPLIRVTRLFYDNVGQSETPFRQETYVELEALTTGKGAWIEKKM